MTLKHTFRNNGIARLAALAADLDATMLENAANVEVALTGAAYLGQTASPLPVSPTVAWDPTFTDLGYIDASGIVEAFADSTTDITAWQNHLLVRRVMSKSAKTFKFTMLETKGSTLATFFKNSGAPVPGTGGGFWEFLEVQPGSLILPYGFDIIDGTTHERIILATAEVTARGDISYKADGAKSYEVTLTSYPSSAGVVATRMSTAVSWGQS